MTVKNFFFTEEDFIFIDNIEASCRVGETKEERAFPQILNISAKIFTSLKKAGKSDHLSDTIDYADFIFQVKDVLAQKDFNLVESVAETVATLALRYDKTDAVFIQVSKRAFPGVRAVGTAVWRSKK